MSSNNCNILIRSVSDMMNFYQNELEEIPRRVKKYAHDYMNLFIDIIRTPRYSEMMLQRQQDRITNNLPALPNVQFGTMSHLCNAQLPNISMTDFIKMQLRYMNDIMIIPFQIAGAMPVKGVILHKINFNLEKDLENMPIIRCEREDSSEDRCNICLGQYKRDDVLKRLNCQHEYHADCVDVWLKRNVTCPMCRQTAFKGFKNSYNYFSEKRGNWVECTVNFVTNAFYL